MAATRSIAKQDGWVAFGIALIDGIGIGMELWLFVLFFAQIPTRLAAALFCDHKKRTSDAARDLVASLAQPLVAPSAVSTPTSRDQDDAKDDLSANTLPFDISGEVSSPSMPARRGRGRPRRHPMDPTSTKDDTDDQQ